MASFGKISNSLIQGTNENTFALANINFDFSLVSLVAPTEFAPVGTALARSRRENAEHGALHRTARKLGALFEGVVPHVPHLVSAYGKRASEIMKHPGLNPSGNADKHGPFVAFVGADATSIWAAATSGSSSIAIHLLGCLLARSFSDPTKSISALVELVDERKRQIRSEGNTSALTATHVAALMAAEQPIERDELQQWDASARAWIQTADSAMRKEYIQLKLILQNISLPVTSGSTLYDGVMRAWTQAMLGLECLLNGEHQSVTDGAILLAISAWHLYPNLLVLGRESTNVDFGDHGMQSSGLLTVGITNARGSKVAKEGIYWSMPLSHYRYYGRALNAVGKIDDRLTIDQLHLVALGSLLSGWNVPQREIKLAAEWLVALESCVRRTKESLGCLLWLSILAKAARDVVDVDISRSQEALALVRFGQRRGTNFLYPRSQPCLPWFGLRFSHIVDSLAAETPKGALNYLRSIVKSGNLKWDEALITHCIFLDRFEMDFRANTPNNPCVDASVVDTDDISDLENDYGPNTYANKGNSKTSDDRPQEGVEMNRTTRRSNEFARQSFPIQLRYQYDKRCSKFDGGLFAESQVLLPDGLKLARSKPIVLKKYMGNPDGIFCLWLARDIDEHKVTEKVQSLQSGQSAQLLDIKTAIQLLAEGGELGSRRVWQYLDGADPYKLDSGLQEVFWLMRRERERFAVTVKSLENLETATNIYDRLDGATISSSIIEGGLYDPKWAVTDRNPSLTLPMLFSCVAMMETGKMNLDAQNLKHVIALSSGNSLFVSTRLLTDPYNDLPVSSVTRIVGNVGRPGVNLLIPPAASPLTRPLSTSFRAVTYAPFDGQREDNFKGTTLHLSFTSHKFPLDYGVTGIKDHQLFFVESVISIHDSGKWVADLDTPKAFSISNENRMGIPRWQQEPCTHPKESLDSLLDDITSIDTWEEFLDTSPGVNIVRAHKNWPARLAASVMLSQTRTVMKDSEETDSEEPSVSEGTECLKNEQYCILENGDDVCWVCLYRRLTKAGRMSTVGPFYIIA